MSHSDTEEMAELQEAAWTAIGFLGLIRHSTASDYVKSLASDAADVLKAPHGVVGADDRGRAQRNEATGGHRGPLTDPPAPCTTSHDFVVVRLIFGDTPHRVLCETCGASWAVGEQLNGP